MKKIIVLIALFFSCFYNVAAQKEKLNELFDKYQETDGVTSIKIAKPMFGMLSKLNLNDSGMDQLKPILDKLNGLKILIIEKPETSENGTPNSQKLNLFNSLTKEILTSVNNLNYEELITVNSDGDKIKFLSSAANEGILDNLLLNISSDEETVLMILDGKISMDDVNKLAEKSQNFNIRNTSSESNARTITSNDDTSQIRTVAKFSGINVSNGIDVIFAQGSNKSVKVETDPGKEKYVKTEVLGDVLRIYIDNLGEKNKSFKKLSVTIENPELKSIKTTSGANFTTINTVEEESVDIDIESGSNQTLRLLVKNKINLNASSGSSLKMTADSKELYFVGTSAVNAKINGSADKATFKLTSAASCNAQDFKVKDVDINVTSAASLKVFATESLNSITTSGGSVRYNGKAKSFTASNNSGGSIKPIDK